MVMTILPGVQNCNLALVCAPSRPCPPFSSNTYALLSELEYVSADTHSQPYAPHGWTGAEVRHASGFASFRSHRAVRHAHAAASETRPEWDVGPIRSATACSRTSGAPPLASAPTGSGSNQLQHQHQLYHPPMPMEAGPNTVARSRWYSATGYAAIVTSGKLAYEAAIAGGSRCP